MFKTIRSLGKFFTPQFLALLKTAVLTNTIVFSLRSPILFNYQTTPNYFHAFQLGFKIHSNKID